MYRELLNKVDKSAIIKTYLAYEVECCLEKEVSEEDFETICENAYDYYISCDYNDIHEIVQATIEAFDENDLSPISIENILLYRF